jgi:hypothetical protein
MTITTTKTRRPLNITAGTGTAIAALGLVIAFFGNASFDPKVVEIGYVLVGLGMFIALTAASIYLFTRK